MNFLRKNHLFIIVLGNYLSLSAAMSGYNPHKAIHDYESNFVHLTEKSLNQEALNEQLRQALKSFEKSEVVAEKVRGLISQGADVKSSYKDGSTLLDAAFTWSDDCVAKALISNYPSLINSRDVNGNSPLHKAIKDKNLRKIDFLLENGAFVNRISLELVIEQAKDNRPTARGGLSSWSLTRKVSERIAKELPSPAIEKVCKRIEVDYKKNPLYCENIYKPLSNSLGNSKEAPAAKKSLRTSKDESATKKRSHSLRDSKDEPATKKSLRTSKDESATKKRSHSLRTSKDEPATKRFKGNDGKVILTSSMEKRGYFIDENGNLRDYLARLVDKRGYVQIEEPISYFRNK